jgi:hypothetical protein
LITPRALFKSPLYREWCFRETFTIYSILDTVIKEMTPQKIQQLSNAITGETKKENLASAVRDAS